MKTLLYTSLLFITLAFNGCQYSKQTHPLKIDTLSFQYRSEDSFKGIVEAISHKKSNHGHMILRTNPNVREGIYFIVSFNASIQRIPIGSIIKLTYITNNEPQENITQWTIPNVTHSLLFQNELYLGITGDKRYSSQTKLIAWKVDVVHPNGQIIATQHSFAW